jgi:Tol biopolymer transport system component
MFLIAAAVLVWTGVGATLTGAAPNYSDWSAPVNLGPVVNSTGNDVGPAISKDGLSLYLNSNRTGTLGMSDIYVSQRASVDAPWGTPVNLGPTINTTANEVTPAFSRDGHWMFFTSTKPGGYGGIDVYASWRTHVHDDFDWQTPVNLGPNINGTSNDQMPDYFANDGGGVPQLLISSDRPGGLGGADLYQSELQPDGTWGPLTDITELNSTANDNRPSISTNGLEIYFYSNRPGGQGGNDVWVASRASIDAPWSTPVNLGPIVNTSASEQATDLSSDGQTLFFGSDRTGGSGGIDLYMTTRTKQRGNSGKT